MGSWTICEALTCAVGPNWRDLGHNDGNPWPPDVFAVCAWLLEETGAYVNVLGKWPPTDTKLKPWCRLVEMRGRAWCRYLIDEAAATPAVITRVSMLWADLESAGETPLGDLSQNRALCLGLLELLALADSACADFGLLQGSGVEERVGKFFARIATQLQERGTLCRGIPSRGLRVFPKMHTPRSGMTLRSLSFHLALVRRDEVVPTWAIANHPTGDKLNLLVVPWPYVVCLSQFSEAPRADAEMAEAFGAFDYEVRKAHTLLENETFAAWLSKLFVAAEQFGEVHGVIFPEAALTDVDFETLEEVAARKGVFVVAGVVSRGTGTASSLNEVWMTFGKLGRDRLSQSKHHRWQVDRKQIEMYGLGGRLSPAKRWWESIDIADRELTFVSMSDFLTMCCLICEDLARQDPVSQIVRSVGPNLVVALLSDGPQLGARWSAHYATVLADDPGSSVLTVTSLGMTKLAIPPSGKSQSRSIALWKDAYGGQREIVLEEGAGAVMLNLWLRHDEPEWTADGRDDGAMAAYPLLSGIHQVPLPT